MNWPWDELGLDGISSLEEIHKAYAKRTKETHPEEDPEGFRRLHKAYQAAKRIVKLKGSKNSSLVNFPKEERQSYSTQAYSASILDEANKSENTQSSESFRSNGKDPLKEEENYDSIFEAVLNKSKNTAKNRSSESNRDSSLREASFEEEWDYDRIFKDALLEKEAAMRKELQKISGLTDENDDWELVISAIHRMSFIRKNNMDCRMWLDFLQGPLFNDVRKKETFILALEIWLKQKPFLNSRSKKALLEHLDISSSNIPAKYKNIYLILADPIDTVNADSIYYQGSNKKKNHRRRPAVIAICTFVLIVFIAVIFRLYISSVVYTTKQVRQAGEWVSEDIKLTAHAANIASAKENNRMFFKVDEIPQLKFWVEYTGDRDLSKNSLGYNTNFHSAALKWYLSDFAEQNGYKLRESSYRSSLRYLIDIPLTELENGIHKLDSLIKKLDEESWYKSQKLQYTIEFVHSGVSYLKLEFPEGFDADALAPQIQNAAPEYICAYVLSYTGFDERYFSPDSCAMFQIKQSISPASPEFYFLLAAIDTESKNVLRTYAYDDRKNIIISFPLEIYKEGITFEELKEQSRDFLNSKKTAMGFPRLMSYDENKNKDLQENN